MFGVENDETEAAQGKPLNGASPGKPKATQSFFGVQVEDPKPAVTGVFFGGDLSTEPPSQVMGARTKGSTVVLLALLIGGSMAVGAWQTIEKGGLQDDLTSTRKKLTESEAKLKEASDKLTSVKERLKTAEVDKARLTQELDEKTKAVEELSAKGKHKKVKAKKKA